MSLFLKKILLNPIFYSIITTGILLPLDNLENCIVYKYTDEGYVIKNFKLDERIYIDRMQIGKPDYGISMAITTDLEVYQNAEYYFDSKNNTMQSYDDLNKSRSTMPERAFSDEIDNYVIKIYSRVAEFDDTKAEVLIRFLKKD